MLLGWLMFGLFVFVLRVFGSLFVCGAEGHLGFVPLLVGWLVLVVFCVGLLVCCLCCLFL